jgi:hypothetical protein
MAIKLIANYSKRLGLPGFSSHQFSVSLETELITTDDIPREAERIYRLLQHNVDEQMQDTGFVPPMDYGMEDATASAKDNNSNGSKGHQSLADHWRCSDKQKELILKLVDEHSLDKNEVDHLSRQRFGKGVKQLSKLESSGLIDELLETYGGVSRPANSNSNRRNGSAYRRESRREAA